jgi:hypothetical protein
LVVGHHFRFAPSSGHIASLKLLTPCANRRTGRAYRWPSALSWHRRRSPREVVRPKVDGDGRQAQSYANPEDRRMMERSSVARSGLHSITSSARESGARAMSIPIAFAVLRSMTNSYRVVAELLYGQRPKESSVLGQFDCGIIRE